MKPNRSLIEGRMKKLWMGPRTRWTPLTHVLRREEGSLAILKQKSLHASRDPWWIETEIVKGGVMLHASQDPMMAENQST